MEALSDNREDEERLAGNLAVLGAFFHRERSSSYQYKNSALRISFRIKTELIKAPNPKWQAKTNK